VEAEAGNVTIQKAVLEEGAELKPVWEAQTTLHQQLKIGFQAKQRGRERVGGWGDWNHQRGACDCAAKQKQGSEPEHHRELQTAGSLFILGSLQKYLLGASGTVLVIVAAADTLNIRDAGGHSPLWAGNYLLISLTMASRSLPSLHALQANALL
jgi:hypothetical protein